MLLTSVCADKVLHPLAGQRQHPGVPEVFDTFVDEVEIDIDSFASCSLREGQHRLHVGVPRGCG